MQMAQVTNHGNFSSPSSLHPGTVVASGTTHDPLLHKRVFLTPSRGWNSHPMAPESEYVRPFPFSYHPSFMAKVWHPGWWSKPTNRYFLRIHPSGTRSGHSNTRSPNRCTGSCLASCRSHSLEVCFFLHIQRVPIQGCILEQQ